MTVGSIFEGFRLGAPNLVGSIRNLVAIILALFSIYSAFFGVFSDMLQRGFHLALVVLLIFSASMVDCRQSDWKKLVVDITLMCVGSVLGLKCKEQSSVATMSTTALGS